MEALRHGIGQIGLNPQHSFRIGAATTAALQGMHESLIKTLGRWESSAYLTYIKTSRPTLAAVASSLMAPRHSLAEPHPRAQAARGSGVMLYFGLYQRNVMTLSFYVRLMTYNHKR